MYNNIPKSYNNNDQDIPKQYNAGGNVAPVASHWRWWRSLYGGEGDNRPNGSLFLSIFQYYAQSFVP